MGANLLATAGPELAQMVVVLLWASTFVVTKDLYAEVTPLAFTAARFVLIPAIAVGVLAARQRRRVPPVRRGDLPRFALAGLTGYTLYQLGFVLGLERTSPFSSSLMIAMTPLATLVIVAVMGERPAAAVWLGALIALAGVAVGAWSEADTRAMWREAARYEPSMTIAERERLLRGWDAALSRSRDWAKENG